MSGHPTIIGSLDPWAGGRVIAAAECVLAPNASPVTLDGTNTWIVGTSGAVLLVDPGPADQVHLDAVRDAVRLRDLRVADILLTHGHADHSDGAVMFAEAFGVGVRALDPQHRLGDEGLTAGDIIDTGDVTVQVVATPGHSSDSLSFYLPDHAAVLTGDTVLGRGTTVVAWPDGSLGQYLASLGRLERLAHNRDVAFLLPGHGPSTADPAGLIGAYLAHRHERLDQVRAAVAAGAATVSDVVAAVYEPLPAGVWPLALASAAAQWEYLRERGEVSSAPMSH